MAHKEEVFLRNIRNVTQEFPESRTRVDLRDSNAATVTNTPSDIAVLSRPAAVGNLLSLESKGRASQL